MAKKDIYVIGYGIDPDTKEPVIGKQVKTWEECKPYIQNVANAKYKGFYTQEEASAWTEKIKQDIFGGNGGKPPVTTATGYSGEDEPRRNLTDTDKEFILACDRHGYDPDKTVTMLKNMFVYAMNLSEKCILKIEDYDDDDLPFK